MQRKHREDNVTTRDAKECIESIEKTMWQLDIEFSRNPI